VYCQICQNETKLNFTDTEQWFLPEMCQMLVCKILKQAVEKLDRVRDLSGRVLEGLIRSSSTTHNDNIEQHSHEDKDVCHSHFRYHLQQHFRYNVTISSCTSSCGLIPHIPHHQEILTLLNSYSSFFF
jgi:hypothetical protein